MRNVALNSAKNSISNNLLNYVIVKCVLEDNFLEQLTSMNLSLNCHTARHLWLGSHG